MAEIERKTINIPEICRVEGHSAVTIDVQDGKVTDVKLDVFEGTRFFEKIVVGHKFDEIPHITSRVCAICSTGHVLAANRALEHIFSFTCSPETELFRELMHLGMIIESHATHICALALPDFLDCPDLMQFATKHDKEFAIWTRLRKLGASIQTLVGGRPFHPVNLLVGGLSRFPTQQELAQLEPYLTEGLADAQHLCQVLLDLPEPFARTAPCRFLALIPNGKHYGYFGETVKSSEGWQESVQHYKQYLPEVVVAYSHAKRSLNAGKPVMVGSMARLAFFSEKLGAKAHSFFRQSPLYNGNFNTIFNNLAQSIEIVEAIDRCSTIIKELYNSDLASHKFAKPAARAGTGVGAVECPRGTLYHSYDLDEQGLITAADMITPSAQNTARIEEDIKAVVEGYPQDADATLQARLETLVRAYDPCNTCATHMVRFNYL